MRRPFFIILFAVLTTLLHTLFFLSPWGQSLENKFLDLWFQLRSPAQPPSDVAIVALDEESYRVLGLAMNQPWPRSMHAQLIQRLKEAGAKKVIFDILFLGNGPDSSSDQSLANALGSMPTVIGIDYGTIEEKNYQQEGLLMPLESFREKAFRTALVGLPEEEGCIRHFMIERSELTKDFLSLSEAAVEKMTNRPGPRDLINYYGPPRTIPTYSYYQILENEKPFPNELIRDKIIFVGLSLRTELGPSQKDAYLTPFSKNGRMFGVEIHATAAANLLTHSWIRRAPSWIEVLGLGLLTGVMSSLLFGLKPLWGALSLLGFFLGWNAAAFVGLLHLRFIPGAVLSIGILPFIYLASTLYYYVIAKRKARQLRKAFQYYLSPEMAREVSRDPQALHLGGEKVTATAMFTDITGFTEISEKMSPESVAHMLNSYFTEVMNEIFENKGTLIKFIGDAVFALWGAPIKTENHAQLACQTAVAIQKEIERFNGTGQFPPLKTRIGIHTGPMIVGNMGSSRRFDFTAIGDSVNLASRVEGINKYFGTEILITQEVFNQLSLSLDAVEMGAIRVAGKKEIIRLHTLFEKPINPEVKKTWERAVENFSQRQWDDAEKKFIEIGQREIRFQKASEIYLKEIQSCRKTPPLEFWEGEINFSSK